MWAGLPVQLGSCPAGHADEASAVDEAWCLPQTESVRGAVIEHITQTTVAALNIAVKRGILHYLNHIVFLVLCEMDIVAHQSLNHSSCVHTGCKEVHL